MDSAVLAHFIGAVLKKGPLQQRIAELHESQLESRKGVIGCLSFIHFIFFLVVVTMSLGLIGFADLNEATESREFILVSIAFVIAAAVSGTVWLAVRQPTTGTANGNWFRFQELVANILLWISAVILTRFFWTGLLLEADAGLRVHISQVISESDYAQTADTTVGYGRWIGWYAFARAVKSKTMIETGVDKGLGACVLTAALRKNQEEGYPGEYNEQPITKSSLN